MMPPSVSVEHQHQVVVDATQLAEQVSPRKICIVYI
jgi:hypothetical protein